MPGWLRRASDTLEWYRQSEAMTHNDGPRTQHPPRDRSPHLLVIARTFPPEVTGGVYRPLAIAEYAGLHQWRTTVLCGRVRDRAGEASGAGAYLARRLPSDVHVLRSTDRALQPIVRLLPRVDGGWAEATELFHVARATLDHDPPDVVLATGPPFNTFITARHLARRYRAALILDYRDEWTVGTPHFVTAGRTDRAEERRCLADADAVVFVSRSILEMYCAAFECLDAKRCHLIVNGWDPNDLAAASSKDEPGPPPGPAGAADLVRIVHAGTLGAYLRPDLFFGALETILQRRQDLRKRLRITFVGRASEEGTRVIGSFPFPDNLELIDRYLPKPDVLRLMCDSAAVLLLNVPGMERALPGKFYEYLASRVPVLVYGDGGEVAEVVRDIGGAWMVSLDADALERALDAICRGEKPPADSTRIEEWLSSRTRQEMVRRFCALASAVKGTRT